ncbi:MAG: RNA polymerase sigma factor [Elusimicrobiota bacterium]
MAKKRRCARPHSVQVEPWEIEVAKSVARSFKTFPEYEDLEAELLKRLLELKGRKRSGVLNWRGFLARSLYNAATDLVRRRDWWRRRAVSLETPVGEGDEGTLSLEGLLAAPDEKADLAIGFAAAWEKLSPDLQRLWHLLAEEGGNVVSASARLGRPRGTVRRWLDKIREVLAESGIDER